MNLIALILFGMIVFKFRRKSYKIYRYKKLFEQDGNTFVVMD
jgi:hypothetical protein